MLILIKKNASSPCDLTFSNHDQLVRFSLKTTALQLSLGSHVSPHAWPLWLWCWTVELLYLFGLILDCFFCLSYRALLVAKALFCSRKKAYGADCSLFFLRPALFGYPGWGDVNYIFTDYYTSCIFNAWVQDMVSERFKLEFRSLSLPRF